MNELEFTEPDDEEYENEQAWLKCRQKRLVESVQTFAPEYKEFPKLYEIIWYGSAH